MRIIGIDLGKVNSQVSERDEKGEEKRNYRLTTTREALKKALGEGERAKVLIEAGTPARWVASCLREMGHEVVVADPNFLPMYIDAKSKRKKTDKRDASLLSQALLTGNWRGSHERSEAAQINKMRLDARARHVRTRTQLINALKAMLSQWGIPKFRGAPEAVPAGIRALMTELPQDVQALLEPEVKALEAENEMIATLDKKIAETSGADPVVKRLQTAPGIGVITASMFVATVDTPERFRNAHELESFLGLVPSEYSSGERRALGGISKAGPTYLRALLVQAAWAVWRAKNSPDAQGLRRWAEAIALRRGKRVAVVALARKLSGILFAMWKKNEVFKASQSVAPPIPAAA